MGLFQKTIEFFKSPPPPPEPEKPSPVPPSDSVSEAERDSVDRTFMKNVSRSNSSGFQRGVMPGFEDLDRANIRQDRINKFKDINMMVNVDSRIDRLLRKLSSDAGYGNLEVIVESGENDQIKSSAQSVIDRTRKNLDDKKKLKGWIKGLLRDGDLYLQLIVDAGEREIVRAKKLAAEMTYSRLDAEGNFPKDKKPYYQENPIIQGDIVREFDEWEIVHLKWDEEDGKPYGNPIFASSRLTWKRLESGEKDVAIRRKIRAGQKKLHTIGTKEEPAEWSEVDEYKLQNKDTIDNPTHPSQDYYSNGLVDIKNLEGDENLGELDDLKYLEGILWIATGVPQALTSGGRESATNFTVIKEQEEDYLRVIGDIDEIFENAFRVIFNFALLLKGINPDSVKYSFKWGSKDREDTDKKVERTLKLERMGYSFRTLFDIIGLPDLSYEEEVERIKAQQIEGIIPYGRQRLDQTKEDDKTKEKSDNDLYAAIMSLDLESPNAKEHIQVIQNLVHLAYINSNNGNHAV